MNNSLQSVEVPGAPEIPGEGKPRRNASSPDKLVAFPPGATTLYENFLHGINESEGGNFLGHRQVDNGIVGPYVWESYPEVQKRVANFGSGLRKLELDTKGILGFFSENNPQYVIGELACYQYSFILVPLYDTLGIEAIEYIINQTEMEYCLSTANKARVLLEMKESLPTLKVIIISDEFDHDQDLIELAEEVNVKIVGFSGIENDGITNPVEAINPKPEDIATISYTSGTTGKPKGVVLSHKNFMSVIGSTNLLAEKGKFHKITKNDIHISHLPLAHVFERTNESIIIYHGASIGFYQGDILKLLDDITELKPTIFVSVPRILNRVYDKVMASIKSKGGAAQLLFNTAYNAKKNGLQKGHVDHWIWDKTIFSPIRAKFGGRMKLIISGSAPISSDVMDFLRISFSADVYEGYGQTENASGLTASQHGDTSSGHVGPPQACTEIKLVDVLEMSYTSKDKPHPRGEICVRGNALFQCYYKSPEKTVEVIDKEGWCHTGDIGMWDDLGRLVIIDRVKNIFKLAQGEYIAPEKIENLYQKHELVAQAFIHGDSLQSSLVGIIVPDPETLLPWAKNNNLGNYNYQELCNNPQVKKHILQTLQKYGRANGLKGFENVKNIHLTHEQFTLQNDLLTPTFKLKRHQAKIRYQKEINEVYSEIS
ncbi:hypothetical protein Glove_658g22 [Diversispora epigaea]|uniref:Long-chain-fatty-acid--CoA ligase n=1 Tax=Diversispora epigaea TaxID=1348612 RepID=A0A397G3X7_9GLOM|nr:hypothetical protein Glove_658g22 [Diversispora epigaea]